MEHPGEGPRSDGSFPEASLQLIPGGHMNLADRTKTVSASLVRLAESALVRFLFAI